MPVGSTQQRGFEGGELSIAAMVACGGDDLAGFGEVLAHVRVEGSAGKEPKWEVVLHSSAAEVLDGLLEVGIRLGEVANAAPLSCQEVGATQREVVESDGENPV